MTSSLNKKNCLRRIEPLHKQKALRARLYPKGFLEKSWTSRTYFCASHPMTDLEINASLLPCCAGSQGALPLSLPRPPLPRRHSHTQEPHTRRRVRTFSVG